ncbi:MAG: helix-turn-helix transcriptional regulator [bacterium]
MKVDSLNKIPIVEITDWQGDSCGLLITRFDQSNIGKITQYSEMPHRINYFQLIILEEGNGFCRIDGDNYFFTSPGLLLVARGQVVNFNFTSVAKGYSLIFSEEYVYKQHEDLEWINKLLIFNPTAESSPIELNDSEYNDILIGITKINEELHKEKCGERDDIIQYLLKAVLLYFERIKKGQITKDDAIPTRSNYLVQFKQKLEENYSTCRSVLFYANLLSITPRKLNQVSFHATGKSAKQMIEERVVLEIKRLLTYTDYTVKEIGYLLGFNDPTNFNKFFKKCFQVTPSDYRQIYCTPYFNHRTVNSNHL